MTENGEDMVPARAADLLHHMENTLGTADVPQGTLTAAELRWLILQIFRKTPWIPMERKTPPDTEPILVLLNDGKIVDSFVKWDHPSFEESYEAFRYFVHDYLEIEWLDVHAWMPRQQNPPSLLQMKKEQGETI